MLIGISIIEFLILQQKIFFFEHGNFRGPRAGKKNLSTEISVLPRQRLENFHRKFPLSQGNNLKILIGNFRSPKATTWNFGAEISVLPGQRVKVGIYQLYSCISLHWKYRLEKVVIKMLLWAMDKSESKTSNW